MRNEHILTAGPCKRFDRVLSIVVFQMTRRLDYRNSMLQAYSEVYTPAAIEALDVLAPLNDDWRELMARRITRLLIRERVRQRIASSGTEGESPRTSTLLA